MKLNAYKYLSVLLITDLIVVIVLLALNRTPIALAGILLAVVIVGLRSQMFRCNNCGCRPGLWILSVWALLFNYESYIADALSLRKCPKCEKNLLENSCKTEMTKS